LKPFTGAGRVLDDRRRPSCSRCHDGQPLSFSVFRRDVRNLYVFYSWQQFRTEKGDLRLTGPGR
jgi:hypothetical protein